MLQIICLKCFLILLPSQNLGHYQAITEKVNTSDLKNITISLAEIAIDQNFDSGLLKDIPILGTVLGIYKSAGNVKDHLFLKKVFSFLQELSDIPQETIDEEIRKIDKSENHKIKVGEKLLYIIDKCEDYEKSKIVALLFRSFLQKGISYKDFTRSVMSIENIIVEDLLDFVAFDGEYVDEGEYSDLECRKLMSTKFPSMYPEQKKIYENYSLVSCGLVYSFVGEANVEREYERDSRQEFKVSGGNIEYATSYIGDIIKTCLKSKILI